ncbi:DUF4412 domain-containing protein [Carboxylicivirga sp. N1Y90]|uniref:DUF4412 domain-containing protein n=1 Tax=Carboxylicivirga fragile TaxID=3417571 RepID=UPI003D332785|nr:DUF4412 domain-containing protein [Marinilabiliaceae bacterium N1Y90]
MNRIVFCLSLFIASLIVVPAHGQSFLEKMAEKAAKKAEAAAEKKAEKEAEKKLDEAFEKAEKSMEDEKKTESSQSESFDLNALMKKAGVSSEPATFEDSYTFQSSITMNMKTYSKEGTLKSDGVMKIYANAGDKSFAYEFVSGELESKTKNDKGIIIMDFKNEASIILSDDNGKKTGVVYGGNGFMDASSWEDEESNDVFDEGEVEEYNPHLTKTGRTKTILGYKCEEYRYEDENSEANSWITKDVDWNSKDFMTTMFRSSMYSNGVWGGFLMESESVDKADGEKHTYTVVDINQSKNTTFPMSSYEITNVGTIQLPEDIGKE